MNNIRLKCGVRSIKTAGAFKWIVFAERLPVRRADKWRVVFRVYMQRRVASAGFTLLAFACLQLAWCSCRPVIDDYHHLKCKRKRLCEGGHDEVPPAGARRDTLGASSLPLFLLHRSPVYRSLLYSPLLFTLRCAPSCILLLCPSTAQPTACGLYKAHERIRKTPKTLQKQSQDYLTHKCSEIYRTKHKPTNCLLNVR